MHVVSHQDESSSASPPLVQQTELDQAMTRYVAGDLPSFTRVYRLVAPRLYGYLLRKTADPQHAEDLIQQTMLQVHRARLSFAIGCGALPWVFTIARRLLINSIRNKRRQRALMSHATELCRLSANRSSPDELIHVRQTASRIASAIERLPEQQRTAFELLRQQKLSLATAAKSLNVTRGALKVRLHRAQSALLTMLADDQD
jgi:RNA polymerase sigma-70 factor (ECF subfamily)